MFSNGSDGQVPRLFEAAVSPDELADVLDRARVAGLLDATPDTGTSGLFEPVPTSVILDDGTTSSTFSVDALGTDPETLQDLTPDQRATREAIRALQTQLRELSGGLTELTPEAVVVFASRRSPGAREVTPWPVDPPLGEGEEAGDLHEVCALVTGDDATELLDVAAGTDSDRWSSEGEDWIVDLRPLLPHEDDCPDAVASTTG